MEHVPPIREVSSLGCTLLAYSPWAKYYLVKVKKSSRGDPDCRATMQKHGMIRRDILGIFIAGFMYTSSFLLCSEPGEAP